jgi:hypothetical protein
MTCGALILAMTAAAAPASAELIQRVNFVDTGTGVTEFCGITAHYDFRLWGLFLVRRSGPDGLVYGMQPAHLTNTLTNLANGKSITHVVDSLDKDLKVIDNGDGTLTIRVMQMGGDRWYDASGRQVFVDSGAVWFDVLIDDAGTPADPTDDEFISRTPDLKVTGQEGALTDDNFCEQLLTVIG